MTLGFTFHPEEGYQYIDTRNSLKMTPPLQSRARQKNKTDSRFFDKYLYFQKDINNRLSRHNIFLQWTFVQMYSIHNFPKRFSFCTLVSTRRQNMRKCSKYSCTRNKSEHKVDAANCFCKNGLCSALVGFA